MTTSKLSQSNRRDENVLGSAQPKELQQLFWLLLVALACVVPGYLFSSLKVTDGFLYQVIAYVRLTLPESHLNTVSLGGYSFGFVEFLPGYPLVLSIFARVLGITPEQLHFIPLAALLIPISYYALAQRLFDSRALAGLFALYGAYDIGLSSHYNVFAYTWSNLIYLVFILVALQVLQQKRSSDVVVLFSLFAGSLFIHYAATMWLIIFAFALNVILLLKPLLARQTRSQFKTAGSLAMPLAFLCAFLAFNQMFYRVWLPSFAQLSDSSAEPITLFIAKLQSYMGMGASVVEPYRYLNPWGETFGWWRMAQFGLIVLPIALWLGKILLDLLRRRYAKQSSPHIELLAIVLFTALIDWFVYGAHSGINMRYLSLVFPLLTVAAFKSLRLPDGVAKGYLALVVVVAVVVYGYGYSYYSNSPPTAYDNLQPAAAWLQQNQIDEPFLSDLDTTGLLLVNSSDPGGDFPRSVVYEAELYGSVVKQEDCERGRQYFASVVVNADGLHAPLHGKSNRIYEPFSFHKAEISSNPCFNKLYDDGSIWLLTRSEGAAK